MNLHPVPMPKNMSPPLHVVAGPKLKIQGEYRLVLNQGTEREVDSGWFPNLITDIGLDRLSTGLNCSQYGSIGTGTTAPANGNTTLQAFVAEKNGAVNDGSSNIGTPTFVATNQIHFVYAQGAVVGNMAEVGVGWGAGGTNLFSRALILDGGGVPTTLTVTSLDQLTVYYRITVTPTLTDITGTVSLGGQTYNYTGRIASVNNWNSNFASYFGGFGSLAWPRGAGAGGYGLNAYSTQTLGAITVVPAGTIYSGAVTATITYGSYSAGQKYQDSTFTAIPAEANAPGGVGSIVFFFGFAQMTYQYSFSNVSGGTVIPKDNTKTMAFTLRLSWDRA